MKFCKRELLAQRASGLSRVHERTDEYRLKKDKEAGCSRKIMSNGHDTAGDVPSVFPQAKAGSWIKELKKLLR